MVTPPATMATRKTRARCDQPDRDYTRRPMNNRPAALRAQCSGCQRRNGDVNRREKSPGVKRALTHPAAFTESSISTQIWTAPTTTRRTIIIQEQRPCSLLSHRSKRASCSSSPRRFSFNSQADLRACQASYQGTRPRMMRRIPARPTSMDAVGMVRLAKFA